MGAIPDDILLQSFPLLPVPGSGCVPAPLMFGTRYLVGADGLYREVTLPWLHAVVPMAPICLARTPYGHIEPSITFRCGPLPLDLLREFKALEDGSRKPLVLATAAGLGRPRPQRREESRGLNVYEADPSTLTVRTFAWDGVAFGEIGRRTFERAG